MAQNTDFANIALKQVGNGPAKYRTWYYGYNALGVAWCAVFTSWVAAQVNGLLNKIIIKTDGAGCFAREGTAKSLGTWIEGGAVPQVGDIITFCWNGLGRYPGQDRYFSDHVGIVVKVEGGYVYTVEGNAGGTNDTSKVCTKKYAINNVYINGYYRPKWATVHTAAQGKMQSKMFNAGVISNMARTVLLMVFLVRKRFRQLWELFSVT